MRADADGYGVDIGEGLEEGAFALHDRHTGLGADVAQAKNGRAVGDDGHRVAAAGVFILEVLVILYFKARLGHAGGIGDGKILGRFYFALGSDLQLAMPFFVGLEGALFDIHLRFLRNDIQPLRDFFYQLYHPG